MNKIRMALLLAAAGAISLPAAASAQVAWDAPMLLPPKASETFGIYLVETAGGGLGALGTWRSDSYNFGMRAGLAENDGGGLGIFGGIDYTGPINRSTNDFPLDVDWVAGVGVGIGDGVLISAPLGLTAGHRFNGQGANFIPYVTPRLVLDAFTGGGAGNGDGDMHLDFAADIGLDLELSTKNNGPLAGLTLRFAGTIGNRSALALGIVF